AKPETQTEIRRVLAQVTDEVAAKAAPRNYAAAFAAVRALHSEHKLKETDIAEFAKSEKYEETIAALAILCAVPVEVVDRLMNGERADPVLILARATGFGWSTVKAILNARPGAKPSPHAFDVVRDNFERLTVATAQRVVRFWQVRQGTGDYAHPAENEIRRASPFAFGFCFVAGAGKVRPGVAPVVGAFGGPDKIRRSKNPRERISCVVSDIGRKTQFASRFQDACETAQIVVLDEAPLPVPPLRPGIGIKQIDLRKRCVGQPVQQFAGVAEMQADICRRVLVDRNERLGHRINESVGGDEPDPRVGQRLRDEMLGAAEANLEPQRFDRYGKKRAQIGRSRSVQVERHSRQQRVE